MTQPSFVSLRPFVLLWPLFLYACGSDSGPTATGSLADQGDSPQDMASPLPDAQSDGSTSSLNDLATTGDPSADGGTLKPDTGAMTGKDGGVDMEGSSDPAEDPRVAGRTYKQPQRVDSFREMAASATGVSMKEDLRHVTTTLHSVSLEWDLIGDTNHNAQAQLFYKRQGQREWKQGMDLVRIDRRYSTSWTDHPFAAHHDEMTQNRFAGSLFFLRPDTTYDLYIHITDQDGGAAGKQVQVTTKPVPSLVPNRVLYATPGSGGGSGTMDDPYGGVEKAMSRAKPGDEVQLLPGDYGEVELKDHKGTKDAYIRITSASKNKRALLHRLTLRDTEYLWVDALDFSDYPNGGQTRDKEHTEKYLSARAALQAHGSHRIAVTNNHFDRYHHSVQLDEDGYQGDHEQWYIVNNVIVGDNFNKTQGYSLSGEGVELHKSSHHTVAFNTMYHMADGVSFPGRNVDIFGNHIYDVNDDLVEPDMGMANVRIWGNKFGRAAQHSISVQPMIAGPWYIVRNLILNDEVIPEGGHYPGPSYTMKYSGPSDRHVLWHNTIHTRGGWASNNYGSNSFLRAFTRNNITVFDTADETPFSYKESWKDEKKSSSGLLYRPPASEYQYKENAWMHDQDYDGFFWSKRFASYHGTSYDSFTELAEKVFVRGYQSHGVRLEPGDFMDMKGKDFGLSESSKAVDTGQFLPNINDDFVGKNPDLGAIEKGAWTPLYGAQPDLTLEQLHQVWSFNG